MSDLKISVAELLGRPGELRDFTVHPAFPGVGTELARLDATPLDARLRAESVMEGILVTGRVEGPTTFTCSRCLTTFASEVSESVCELFATPGHEVEEETYRVQGNEIDLEPMLRDALVLALPLNPVCRAECRGLCAHCGTDLNEGDCDCREESVDPRWAGLAALKEKLES